MDFNFDTSAFDDLENGLHELETLAAQKRVLTYALRAASKPILSEMKSLYHAQFSNDTGLLADSFRIRVRVDKKTGRVFSSIGVQSNKKSMRATRKKRQLPPSVYAYFLEYGTDAHYLNNGTMRAGVRARPFIRPAFDRNIDKTVHTIRAVLRDRIDKAMARQNRKKMKQWR